MTKILVIGAELPRPDSLRIEAENLRTLQFVTPLTNAGHQVYLISRRRKGEPCLSSSGTATAFQNLVVDFHKRGWVQQVNKVYRQFNPDCIVGIMYRGAMYATRISNPKPIWMDLHGDILSENQAALSALGTDKGALSAIWADRVVLSRGDVFSSCSERQKYAVIGKLGLLNRLTRSTFGYEFVHCIPPGASADGSPGLPQNARSQFLVTNDNGQPEVIPADAVVVLWSGSYNVWMDARALFDGLARAMTQDETWHYVSTGTGAMYPKFRALVDASPFRSRFHLLGWQPYSVARDLYSRADMGISIDAHHYEALLGTRTRLVEMAAAGLALLSTRGCELVESLERDGAIWTFDVGDSAMLSSRLVELARNSGQRNALAQRARQVVRAKYSFDRTTEPLLDWVQSPNYAPDKGVGSFPLQVENTLRLCVRRALWRLSGQIK